MKALILANGDPPSADLARRLAAEHDLVIATDGAAERAARLGIAPHIICGDFDSIDMETARRAFPSAEFVPTPDQNYADLEKALQLARARGAASITIIGAAGGRIDHTFANFALLLHYGREFPMTIVDDRSTTRALTSTNAKPNVCTLNTQAGDTISLIAQAEGAQVSVSGVAWDVTNFALAPGTQGVSNVANSIQVTVEVQQGAVLLCHLTHGVPQSEPVQGEQATSAQESDRAEQEGRTN
jgi:thiamine pyrophosphokinase